MNNNPSNEASIQKLKEELAAIEHERWASWQQWVFDMYGTYNDDDSFTISPQRVANMQRQINLPYAELTRKEQESDLAEVDRYWPLIESYIAHHNKEYAKQLLQRVEDEVIGKDVSANQYSNTNPTNKYLQAENRLREEQREILKRIRTSIEKGE